MENNNEHFLKWITVEEFKCFSNFHAEGFKRVNLIGGKNNVGKTALMEAVYINTFSIDVATMTSAIVNIKLQREYINLASQAKKVNPIELLEKTKKYKSKSNLRLSMFSIKENDGIKEYVTQLSSKAASVNANFFNFQMMRYYNIMYLSSVGASDDDIVFIFNEVQKKDKEPDLNKNINEFDYEIQTFKIIDGKPQCKSNGIYRDITEFGDGLKSYISIICSLYNCQNGYLFIDELDNGIHYEHFDKLWEIILTLSKEMNCQVFATTHSKEMLESFARVAKKLDEQDLDARDVSYTLLIKNKLQELKSITIDYKNIIKNIADQGIEVR